MSPALPSRTRSTTGQGVAVDGARDEHLRVQVEAGQAVAAHGGGVGARGEHAAQAAAAVVQGGGEQLGPDAAPLHLGGDREGRQDPHQLADPRQHAPDDPAVELGHPAAVRVGAQRVGAAPHPGRVALRRTGSRVRPVALEGAPVDLGVGAAGQGGHGRQVRLPGRPDEEPGGHDTCAAKRPSRWSQFVYLARTSSDPSDQPLCSRRTRVPAPSSVNVTSSWVGCACSWPSQNSWP